MTETPQADALLIALISGTPQIEAFADLTDEYEREKVLHVLLALLSDPSWDMRCRAVQALGALGDRRAVGPLIETLNIYNRSDGVGWEFYEATFEVLVAFGDPEAILPLSVNLIYRSHDTLHERFLTEFDKQDLIRVFGAASVSTADQRYIAIRFLGQIEEPESIQLLLKALDEGNKESRIDAACALNRMGVIDAVPSLAPYATDANHRVRTRTVLAFSSLGDARAIPLLLPLLTDPILDVRIFTAISLAVLGNPVGAALTRGYIATINALFIYRFLRPVLETMSVKHALLVPRLMGVFDRDMESEALVARVADRLAEGRAPDAMDGLQRLLKSDDEMVQKAAQWGIDDTRKYGNKNR
jgi:HEAT repeat protein